MQIAQGDDPGAAALARHASMQPGQPTLEQAQPEPAQQGAGAALVAKPGDPTAAPASHAAAAEAPAEAPGPGPGPGESERVKIIDLFIYNGEPIAELRLQYLAPIVDEVVIVESRLTFSGHPKPQLFMERDAQLFRRYQHVTALIIDAYPEPDEAWLARQARNRHPCSCTRVRCARNLLAGTAGHACRVCWALC